MRKIILLIILLNCIKIESNEKVKNKNIKFCVVNWTHSDIYNNSKGPDFDIAEAFAKYKKAKFEYTIIKWPEIFENEKNQVDFNISYKPRLLNNQCDLFAISMTKTKEREKLIDIVTIFAGRTFVVTNEKNKSNIKDYQNLENLETGYVKGTTYEDHLIKIKNEKKLNLKFIDLNGASSIDLLINNKIDFVLIDTIQAFYFMRKYPKKLFFSFPVSNNEEIGWGFAKDNKFLKNEFEEFIKVQKGESESDLNKVFKKYFGMNIKKFESIVFSSLNE